MGRKARLKPQYLAQKLLQIRDSLQLSQNDLIDKLGFKDVLDRSRISEFEAGAEPPLPVLLRYAQLANVYVDALINDDVNLPSKLPAPTKHEGIKRITPKRKNFSG